jgi:hypothetical protein
LTWTDPDANGSPITGYKIYFLSGDNSYVEETLQCDGQSATVLENRYCSYDLKTLDDPPFSIAQGDDISIKVAATNDYGDSELS